MTVSVSEAGPFERLVGFELTDAEIEAAKSEAAKRLSKDLKLKGFRPGKAPRPVVEAAVGADRLRSEAIDDAIPPKLTDVLLAESLSPAVSPSLENIEDVDGGVTVQVKVTLWPSLSELPPYRDRRVEIESPEVTDEEVETQLDRMREQFGQVEEVERPAGEGDFVSVDISATVGDRPIGEASATELLYRIGSEGLLEGADEALNGTSAGDVVTLESPLPEAFGDDAGQEATFSITVNEVKEMVLPELDDAWVDENTEYETVEEVRSNLFERMSEMKQSTLARRFTERAMETLLDQVEVDIPEAVVRAEMDAILHRFIHRLEQQEISLADYFSATGIEQDAFLADLTAQANQSIRTQLLLAAIAEEAGLEVEDEELEFVLNEAASQSDDPAAFVEAVRGTPQELSVRSDMLRDKALSLVIENATPVDPDGNVIELDLEGGDSSALEVLPGEVVEGEVVEAEVVEGEIVAGELIEDLPGHDDEES